MTTGDVVLCDLNPVAGREQGGIRPVVVVSHDQQVSYAMTEQIRAVFDERAGRHLGRVSSQTLTAIGRYLHLFIS